MRDDGEAVTAIRRHLWRWSVWTDYTYLVLFGRLAIRVRKVKP